MEVCFSDLKEKEIVNIYDGKKLGRIIDILFDTSNGQVRGIVVPGDKKLFRKNDDIFVPLDRLKKIGDDVILVSLSVNSNSYSASIYDGRDSKKQNAMANARYYSSEVNHSNKPQSPSKSTSKSGYSSFVRFRPLDEKKYR